MGIRFTKMHGLGNDFMVVDAISQPVQFTPENIRLLARRDTGIGFDQCLIVELSHRSGIDFNYRIFNANGQEVGQCGNGARCLALFLQHYALTQKKTITVATATTRMQLVIHDNNTVSVEMGRPKFNPADIPLQAASQATWYTISLPDTGDWQFHAVNVGNPHAVLLVPDVNLAPVERVGKQLSEHALFPEQVNVGFMQIDTPEHIRLRVYERGCGETQACGSGAVAAAAVGKLFHKLKDHITVSLPGGDLIITWASTQESIVLTGPAQFVYEGYLEFPALMQP